ncbi:MAG: toprim domain-containing protein [Planctomycetes bacterium]|nr:toprim domain-containing protein [Planctomycetota bacterium]
MSRSNGNLVAFLEEEVLPRLFERLDTAFPEFGWEPNSEGWVATCRETTKRVLDARPERVICNRPFGFYAHGGESRTWLAHVSGGHPPRGDSFVAAVRRLCELAGVPFPDLRVSPKELRAFQQAEARREALEAVTKITQQAYGNPVGSAARAYVAKRGLDEQAAKALGLGFYSSPAEVRRALAPELHAAAKDAGLLRDQLSGHVSFPWLDDWGRPLTLYFRWPAKQPPDGRSKTLALPGVGTKRSPLYFDRARAAGERDLVLVEGVLDGAVLQALGDARVVACVGAQLSKAQVATLTRHQVSSVTICLDPDGAGEKGTLSCLRALSAAGIAAYVAPTLPDRLDPDEFVLREGIEGWRRHVAKAIGSARYRAERALAKIAPGSSDPEKDRAVREVGEVVAELRGPSAGRERSQIAKLLAKATGYGVGALKSELPQAGSAPPKASKPGQDERGPKVTVWPYREDRTGLVWVKERFDKDGRPAYEDVPLANFSARITADVSEDDGAEERRFFEITAKLGQGTRVLQIPASQFGGMGWVLEHLGAGATLEPGKVIQERTRHGIQVLSGTPPQQRVFTHLGWRKVEDRWVYLHGGGAIGESGAVADVRVRLDDPLSRFELPEAPEGDELVEALQACLRFLELGPKRLTIPLLALPYRAVQGEVDLTAFLYGGSGFHKSCLAALVQQHFGAGLHFQNLPGSWSSSANALEGALFLAKNALFVIDDFIPTGSAHDKARSHRDVDRVVRGQGNRAGRQRMRADATLRPVKRSRALVLCTGEELPRGESLTARMLMLPVGPGDVDRERLTRCQADADAGLYAKAMSAFLRWLAPNYGRVQAGLRAEVAKVRAEFTRDNAHRRLADVGANLYLGLRAFARFVQESGLYSPAAAEAFLGVARAALLEALGYQVQNQREADPVRRFFELVSSSLASGRAHVAGRDGKVPADNPLAWGWRLATEGRPERESWKPGASEDAPYWNATGERIGWVNDDDLYLEPSAIQVLVQRAAGEEGFPLSPRSLRRRLLETGHLKTTAGKGRETACTRVTLGGARRSVLHLSAERLVGQAPKSTELFADAH